MTDPRKDDALDEDLKALSRAYRAAPAEDGPPAALDDAILAAARRAAHSRPQPVAKAWFSRSSTPLAAAAVLVLTVSIGFLSLDDPKVQVRTKGEDVAMSQAPAEVAPPVTVIVPTPATVPAPAAASAPLQPKKDAALVAEPPPPEPPKLAMASPAPQTAPEGYKRSKPAAPKEPASAMDHAPVTSIPVPVAPQIAAMPAPSYVPAPPAPPAPQAPPPAPVAPSEVVLGKQKQATVGIRGLSEATVPEAKREAATVAPAASSQAQSETLQFKSQKDSKESANQLRGFAADPSASGSLTLRSAPAQPPARAEPSSPLAADAVTGRRSDELRARKPLAAATAPATPALARDQSAQPASKTVESDHRLAEKAAVAPGAKLGAGAESEATLSPEDWVKRILDLRKQGKVKEAEEELRKFRKRYPDYALPVELRETR